MERHIASLLDPFVALAAAATATTRLVVGTGVCLLPQHDPISLAETVATLDHLSGGRVVLADWMRLEPSRDAQPPDRPEPAMASDGRDGRGHARDLVPRRGQFRRDDRSLRQCHGLAQARPTAASAVRARWRRTEADRPDRGLWRRLDAQPRLHRRCDPGSGGRARARFAELGRTPQVHVTWLPSDRRVVEHYENLGVDTAIFLVPAGSRDEMSRSIDSCAEGRAQLLVVAEVSCDVGSLRR